MNELAKRLHEDRKGDPCSLSRSAKPWDNPATCSIISYFASNHPAAWNRLIGLTRAELRSRDQRVVHGFSLSSEQRLGDHIQNKNSHRVRVRCAAPVPSAGRGTARYPAGATALCKR
jgi:hypothetical protein